MNTDKLLIVLMGILLVFVVCALTAYILLLKTREKKEIRVDLKGKKDFLYASYLVAVKLQPLRKYMGKIRKRIEMLDLSDNWTISRKTMRFTLISIGTTLMVFVILLFSCETIYFMLISIFTAYMLHKQIINMLVDKIDNKLLRQFEIFLGNVRHHYHEHGMIDEAIYDSMEECGYEIALHANRMYEVLTASNVDDRIEQYNESAPNKYMKTFVAMCYLVQRFGDKQADGKSIYLDNLNYLKQEINMELLRREKLSYLFQSLSVISVFPIFTIRPLENWAVSNIPELKEYYSGEYGFITVVVLFVLVFAAYQLIGRLQSSSVYSPIEYSWCAVFLKIPFLCNFVEGIIERKHTRALKYDKLLKKTGVKASVNEFILKQLLYTALTFILMMGVFINIHAIARHNLLYTSKNLQLAELDEQIDFKAESKIVALDREYILLFEGRKATFQEIDQALRDRGEFTDTKQSGIAARRILDKLRAYNNHSFKWWELLISLGIAWMACYLPWWMLLFRERILRMNMEDEVMGFHTIILMLMHIERIDVEEILHWMEQFANIFKDSIAKCINNYEYGDRKALEELAVDEPYTPFVRIVENLQSAADKITIRHAFDELKTEREYYQEKRKQDNEIMVNRKGMWGKLIAFIPVGATIFLYLLLPFLWVSVTQFMGFSKEINNAF